MRPGEPGGERDVEALIAAHHQDIYRLCRRMMGNDADAQDASQEALIAIVRGLDRYDGRSAFGTWAYRVTVNKCLDELRRRQRRPVPFEGASTIAERRDDRPGFDESLADRERLDGAMAELSPGVRAAVVLRDVAGLDYAAIGEVLSVPPGTVRSRIARGRAALAEELGNQDRSDGVGRART